MKTKNKTKTLTGIQKTAVERMHRLNELAEKEVHQNPQRSHRYVQLIQKFSTRFRVSIPTEIKNQFCKKCGNYWMEGITVKRRLKKGTWNSTCQLCHSTKRKKPN